MGYAQPQTAVVVAKGRRLVRRAAPAQLGVAPIVVAGGIKAISALTKVFGSRGSSLAKSQRDHIAFMDSLFNQRDIANLRTIAAGGTPTKVTPPWTGAPTNYGSRVGGAKDPNEFPAYRAYAAELVNQLTATSALINSELAPVTRALIPATVHAAPTAAAPMPTLTQTTATVETRPAGRLAARQTSPRLNPAAPVTTAAGGRPAPRQTSGALTDILKALAVAVPAVAPVIREIAPSAAPVTVSVTSPAAATGAPVQAGAPASSFFEQNKGMLIAGGLGLVGLLVLPKLLGGGR